MKIEPLTRDIYIKFDGSPPPVTMKGIALTDGADVLAMLSVASFSGEHFILCGIKKNVRKRDILKGWKVFKELHMHPGAEYYALIDSELNTAPAFLRHFGFEPFKDDIYIYRG